MDYFQYQEEFLLHKSKPFWLFLLTRYTKAILSSSNICFVTVTTKTPPNANRSFSINFGIDSAFSRVLQSPYLHSEYFIILSCKLLHGLFGAAATAKSTLKPPNRVSYI